uniref:Uncharacterized protein n=1 Tax=Arundo donax TaxID=35708 RepID=A0A0A9F1C9_ARUDO
MRSGREKQEHRSRRRFDDPSPPLHVVRLQVQDSQNQVPTQPRSDAQRRDSRTQTHGM